MAALLTMIMSSCQPLLLVSDVGKMQRTEKYVALLNVES